MGERLGKLLVAEGLVTPDEVGEALRHQIVHGGRLGTNLVELRCLQLDPLTEVLGLQHDLAPTLQDHFDERTPELAERLTPELAARWHAVPLYVAGEGRDQVVVVASTDPLPDDGIAELEAQLGLGVVNGIAAELRILYWLERLYGIRRLHRFKRLGRHGTGGDGQAEQTDPERRGFVRTLAEAESPEPPSQLARIAVRKIAVPLSGEIELPPTEGSLDGTIKAIRRATGRGRVARLAVNVLCNAFDQSLSAGMLLIVRDGIAIGWKGFVRDRSDEIIEAVAVPLDEPSVLRAPHQEHRSQVGPVAEPSELDQRLWRLLGAGTPGEVAVLPIHIFDEVPALLYAQAPERIAPPDAGGLAELAQAVSAALHRLMRAAER